MKHYEAGAGDCICERCLYAMAEMDWNAGQADCAYVDASECSAARERSVAGVSNVIPDCPRHGAYIGEA